MGSYSTRYNTERSKEFIYYLFVLNGSGNNKLGIIETGEYLMDLNAFKIDQAIDSIFKLCNLDQINKGILCDLYGLNPAGKRHNIAELIEKYEYTKNTIKEIEVTIPKKLSESKEIIKGLMKLILED
mgnify:CR=1 FL=1